MKPAPILYFYPKANLPPLDHLAEIAGRYGVDPAAHNHPGLLESIPHTLARNYDGPGDARGLLVSYGAGGRRITGAKDLYRWTRIAPGIHCGIHRDAGPADFLRPEADGRPVTLGDGRDWLIPQANPLLATCSLDYREVIVDHHWQRLPAPAHELIANYALELAAAYRQALLSDCQFEFDDDRLRTIACAAIAHNYHLSPQEMSLLRIFHADAWRAIIETLIDWPAYLQLLTAQLAEAGTATAADPTDSRATPATNATASGSPATSQPTSPPSPTPT